MKNSSTEKQITLKEALPAPPIMNLRDKTIIYHGVLYGFPEFSDDQVKEMVKSMEDVNMSFKYSKLNSLLKRLEPFRLRLAKRRIPGKLVEKWTKEDPFIIERSK